MVGEGDFNSHFARFHQIGGELSLKTIERTLGDFVAISWLHEQTKEF
jgi:hypothetical protein